LEPLEVGFNEGDLKFFETYGVRDIEFWVFFVIGNSIKLQERFWNVKSVG
jgi:hypothetical protein